MNTHNKIKQAHDVLEKNQKSLATAQDEILKIFELCFTLRVEYQTLSHEKQSQSLNNLLVHIKNLKAQRDQLAKTLKAQQQWISATKALGNYSKKIAFSGYESNLKMYENLLERLDKTSYANKKRAPERWKIQSSVPSKLSRQARHGRHASLYLDTIQYVSISDLQKVYAQQKQNYLNNDASKFDPNIGMLDEVLIRNRLMPNLNAQLELLENSYFEKYFEGLTKTFTILFSAKCLQFSISKKGAVINEQLKQMHKLVDELESSRLILIDKLKNPSHLSSNDDKQEIVTLIEQRRHILCQADKLINEISVAQDDYIRNTTNGGKNRTLAESLTSTFNVPAALQSAIMNEPNMTLSAMLKNELDYLNDFSTSLNEWLFNESPVSSADFIFKGVEQQLENRSKDLQAIQQVATASLKNQHVANLQSILLSLKGNRLALEEQENKLLADEVLFSRLNQDDALAKHPMYVKSRLYKSNTESLLADNKYIMLNCLAQNVEMVLRNIEAFNVLHKDAVGCHYLRTILQQQIPNLQSALKQAVSDVENMPGYNALYALKNIAHKLSAFEDLTEANLKEYLDTVKEVQTLLHNSYAGKLKPEVKVTPQPINNTKAFFTHNPRRVTSKHQRTEANSSPAWFEQVSLVTKAPQPKVASTQHATTLSESETFFKGKPNKSSYVQEIKTNEINRHYRMRSGS